MAILVVYVAANPLTENKNPSKEDAKQSHFSELAQLEPSGLGEHKLVKRNDAISSAYAFQHEEAERQRKRDRKAHVKQERPLYKREIPTDPDHEQKERKTRDISDPEPKRKTRHTTKEKDKPKDNKKDRIARDVPKDQDPKHVEDSDPKQLPSKPIPVEKREIRGNDDDDDKQNYDDHKLKTRATDDKKDDKPEKKPKREVKQSKPDLKDVKQTPPQKLDQLKPSSALSSSNSKH